MTRAATRYLLDTSVLSELLCPRPAPAVVQRLQGLLARQLFASAMSRFELRYGARLHPDGDRLWQRIEGELLPLVQWLPIDDAVALQAADQAARERLAGRPSGGVADPLIAATAQVHGCVMVTRNLRHFEGVEGLVMENWFDAPSSATRSVGRVPRLGRATAGAKRG